MGPNHGLLVLLGVQKHDSQDEIQKMAHKLLNYRVFEDHQGKMNHDIQQAKGQMLMVSQFTLAANTNKGLRPSFSSAATVVRGNGSEAADHLRIQD